MNTLATMLKIFAILAALTGPARCVIVTVPENSVETTIGGNITLLCTYRTGTFGPNLFIQWTFYSAKAKAITLIYYSQQGQSYSYGEFRGRIRGANRRGNASITIFNMQASETGQYTCEVFSPMDVDAQSEKSMTPHCSLRGTPEMGHLISLNCFSEEGLPSPSYRWQKVSGDTVTPVTEAYNPKTGVLVMSNLTKSEEGYYRCTAVNSLGRKFCQISL
uniref:V-set and immunoglobulin domain-containing protein 1-like n=1 Tax=Euleptes europaea TaxID=460621 RepID=UPI00253F6FE3|nr:V-set and immunoglobulin domain-containing protein 1-like [Euleptes europaea]